MKSDVYIHYFIFLQAFGFELQDLWSTGRALCWLVQVRNNGDRQKLKGRGEAATNIKNLHSVCFNPLRLSGNYPEWKDLHELKEIFKR